MHSWESISPKKPSIPSSADQLLKSRDLLLHELEMLPPHYVPVSNQTSIFPFLISFIPNSLRSRLRSSLRVIIFQLMMTTICLTNRLLSHPSLRCSQVFLLSSLLWRSLISFLSLRLQWIQVPVWSMKWTSVMIHSVHLSHRRDLVVKLRVPQERNRLQLPDDLVYKLWIRLQNGEFSLSCKTQILSLMMTSFLH